MNWMCLATWLKEDFLVAKIKICLNCQGKGWDRGGNEGYRKRGAADLNTKKVKP